MQLNCEQHESIDNPTWDDVDAAIRALDGRKCTDVTLGGVGGDPYIAIGGGNGQYSVFSWTQDERSLILTNPKRPEGKTSLVLGGQSVWWHTRHILDIEMALAAARHYLQTGQAAPDMIWEEE